MKRLNLITSLKDKDFVLVKSLGLLTKSFESKLSIIFKRLFLNFLAVLSIFIPPFDIKMNV